MVANARHIELAKSLPPTLLRFFARHPPAVLRASASEASKTGIAGSNAPQAGYEQPFDVVKNEQTGKFRNPVYSLRRQADLAKLAQDYGVAELLPASIKSPEARFRKREQEGLKVKGTGVGQKVRGHWWERTLFTRQEKRRQAMRDMPAMIAEWKRLGHGRRWTKWPK